MFDIEYIMKNVSRLPRAIEIIYFYNSKSGCILRLVLPHLNKEQQH